MALRGTLSVVLTTLAAMLLGRSLGVGIADFAAGIVLSMMAPFLTREPTLRQRQRSLLMLAIPALLATVAAALLHGRGLAGNAVFLLLVFGCFLLQARSPRAVALGLVAVVAMYVGLFLKLPVATLWIQLASVAMAVPLVALACFVLVPMRPARTLRRTLAAVQSRAAAALQEARTGGGEARTALRRRLAALNEVALAADDQVALLDRGGRGLIRQQLVALELAVAHAIAALGTAVPADRVRHLRLHERRLRRARWTARHAGGAASPDQGWAAAIAGVARAAAALESADIDGLAAAAPMPPPPPGPLAWRVAARATVASLLAMAGGMALSPDRWFWAVIATYVVFLGARTSGDTMLRGAQRLAGTLAGLVAGLLLANAVSGDPALQAAALLLAVFGMYYLFLVSYTVGIFCVTVLLGLLYSLMGTAVGPLLVLRLEETAIGTLAAILAALLVFPVRTRALVTNSGRTVLAGLAEVVRCSREAQGGGGASPLEALRRLDRQVADLRLALVPLAAGRSLLRRAPLERPVPALLECVHWARVLALASATQADGAPFAAGQARAIEERLARLGRGYVAPIFGLAAGPGLGGERGTPLDRLDQAVTLLAERLELRAADAAVGQ